MQEISDYILEGSNAYISRQLKTVIYLGALLAIALYFVDIFVYSFIPITSFAFILGTVASLASGRFAMLIAANTNSRTTFAATESRNAALKTAYKAGLVMGLVIMASSIIGIAILFSAYTIIFAVAGQAQSIQPATIIAYGFGASFAALFAQLGGGIFTKAADVGADLVGKLEAGIPEDDPRNPGVIADNVGDAVGDCAGRGADLFESITGETIGAMIVGSIFYLSFFSSDNADVSTFALPFVLFPLIAGAFSMISSILTLKLVSIKESETDAMKPMKRAFFATSFINFVVLAIIVLLLLNANWFLVISLAIGLALGVLTLLATEYYTARDKRPVRTIADASTSGAATNIITGISVGLESTWIPVIGIVLAVLSSFFVGWGYAELNPNDPLVVSLATTYGVGFSKSLWGVFSVTVATIALLSTAPMILAMDGYGPIADQSGGIAEMSDAGKETRERIDSLDAVGNTTKALAKGYGMTSAGLAAILLFQAYLEDLARSSSDSEVITGIAAVDIADPLILSGLILGALLPFIFSSMSMGAVGRAAKKMVDEIRRQFKEIPGIMEGTNKPDYAACVDVSTRAALKEMIAPSLLVVISPIIVGIALGPLSLAAFLIGATASGILLGLTLNNGGGAWDNAKKLIETGLHGGKGSPAHQAAIVGDTVGDPSKDTSGPAIHVLIKLVNTIAITLLPLFVIIWIS